VVTKLDVKLTFRKNNYLPGNYDVDRIQNENLRGKLQEQLDIGDLRADWRAWRLIIKKND
jgi:outer membrane usher protein FimD/PapC